MAANLFLSAEDGLVQSQERRARQYREQFHQEQMARIKAEREKKAAEKKNDDGRSGT